MPSTVSHSRKLSIIFLSLFFSFNWIFFYCFCIMVILTFRYHCSISIALILVYVWLFGSFIFKYICIYYFFGIRTSVYIDEVNNLHDFSLFFAQNRNVLKHHLHQTHTQILAIICINLKKSYGNIDIFFITFSFVKWKTLSILLHLFECNIILYKPNLFYYFFFTYWLECWSQFCFS